MQFFHLVLSFCLFDYSKLRVCFKGLWLGEKRLKEQNKSHRAYNLETKKTSYYSARDRELIRKKVITTVLTRMKAI